MQDRQLSLHGQRRLVLPGTARLRKALDRQASAVKKLVHDLRNPINGILLTAQLLEETSQDPEVERLARRIQNQCAELSGLVDRAAAQVVE